MLAKGIITEIDYNSNTGKVRIPIFENTNKAEAAVLDTVFSIAPGAYNGYKINDVVILGFENNILSNPIIIGKLYLGVTTETQDGRGTINCSDLVVNDSASIPVSTNLLSTAPDERTNVSGNPTTYKTIADIIKTLQEQTLEIEKLKVRVEALEKK